MPQNIKINNVRSLYSRVLLDEYYDFMLYKGEAYGGGTGEECLVADFSDFNIDKKALMHNFFQSEFGKVHLSYVTPEYLESFLKSIKP